MKKMFSLIRASMSEGMNLFKISTKKNNLFTKIGIPIFLTFTLMGVMYSYSELIIGGLVSVKMEFVLLSLFIFLTSIMTLIEGVYKSGNLIFNCRDDNLLLSLPIDKSTVLFIRVFKFYLFELIYNSIFLLPSMLVYAKYMNPGVMYYVVSFIGLLLFPIFPILLSCLIGLFITFLGSKFRMKNLAQTFITIGFLIVIMFFSYNSDSTIMSITNNSSVINDFITGLYYPIRVYTELILKFDIVKLLEFIFVHLVLFGLMVFAIGKIYFNVNSNIKAVKFNKNSKRYVVRSMGPIRSLVRKEFNRFINSPVFVTNAGFGLVLFVLGCFLITFKFDFVIDLVIKNGLSIDELYVKKLIPLILFGFIIFTSFMTSITSSMVSLEGRKLNILKSLPIRSYDVIRSKVLCSLLIMFFPILIGDMIIFFKFKFSLFNMFLILIASILFPMISGTIGIIVNLKYPRMDAKNDTEVVKQSMSSMVSVFIGMMIIAISLFVIYKLMGSLTTDIIMLIFIVVFGFIYMGLRLFLNKVCDKWFDNISI